MAYTVATAANCTYCSTPTCRRRERDRKPMCLGCGIERYEQVAREQLAGLTESRRQWLEGQIRWADRGGIEQSDQGELWRARMRKHVERCRTELASWVPTPTHN